jgi:hypothetical protein
MNRIIFAKTVRRGLCVGALFASAFAASADTLITFQVDMTQQVNGGTFVNGTDTVSVAGAFGCTSCPDTWNPAAYPNFTNDPTSANPNLYSGTIDYTNAPLVLDYKFVIDGSSWETLPDGDNRCAQIPPNGGSLLLAAPFFDDAGPAVTANVTFQVDMAEQILIGNFNTNTGSTVEVHGFFNGWGSGDTLTNDPTIMTTNSFGVVTTDVYVGTFAVDGSTNGGNEFKYVIQPGNDYEGPNASDGDPDNNNNRFFVNTTQTLPIVYFSDAPPITVTTTLLLLKWI